MYIIRNNAHESSDCWMSIQRLSCFFNLCSSCSSRSNKRRLDCLLPPPRGRLCCRGGLTAPYYSHRWPAPAATAVSHRSRTSEPSYSSPRGHPLPCLHQLFVIPFLGLAVVHRPGALGAAWSTWSRNGYHRTWTVCGEADSWVHGRSPVFL